jgi:hypothetical protein
LEADGSNIRLPLRDPMLNSHCRLQNQLMAVNENYSAALKSLRNVAKALNKLDWAQTLPVTADFFVTLIDDHGHTDFAADIKSVIPAATYKKLKASGWI